MFKKILVVGLFALFFSATIFAVEENASQIMMPITAGTITLQNSDFSADGTAVVPIKNFGPGSCPSPYVSPAAKYPWIMAYPSEVVAGDVDVMSTVFEHAFPKNNVIKNLIVTPSCNSAECALTVNFSSEDANCSGIYPDTTCTRFLYSATEAHFPNWGGKNGYLKITYVAYCSTQPIQSDTGKHEPEQK